MKEPFTLPMKCLICEATWDAQFDLPSTGEEVEAALSNACPNCNNRDTSMIVIVDTES